MKIFRYLEYLRVKNTHKKKLIMRSKFCECLSHVCMHVSKFAVYPILYQLHCWMSRCSLIGWRISLCTWRLTERVVEAREIEAGYNASWVVVVVFVTGTKMPASIIVYVHGCACAHVCA